MGGLSYAHPTIFHWFNQTLCGENSKIEPDIVSKDAFVEIFKKYGGEIAAEKSSRITGYFQLHIILNNQN